MKKNLLTLGLMIAGISVFAQTPRLSLFEEFTGETCPPCAATNPGLNVILASPTNTPKVVAIKWQVPIPSAPSATWSLYKTNQTEIDWRYTGAGYGYPSQWTSTTAITSGINAAPTGLFDGQHQWLFGAASDHPTYVSNAVIASAQSYTSAFSITMARAWDNTFSSVNLTVNIVASANFTSTGALVFRTVMVEKEIHFATQPGTNGEKDFEDVAIKSFPTLQGGTGMVSNWVVGQTQTFTLNCPVPAYARDKSQIAFVGFIQDDGNRKVAQAGRAGTSPLANDAKAVSAAIPLTCTNSAIPSVTIKNNGTNNITGFAITPYVNGVAGTVYNWSGVLAVGASTTFPLNSISVIAGANTFSYNISSVVGTDYNLLNNGASVSFVGVLSYQGSPVSEGFASATFPPTNWSTYNNYAGTTWARVTTAGIAPTPGNATKLDFYTGVPDQSVNELMMPPMSFTVPSGLGLLSFDVAYSQYVSADNDKLEVLVSNNCGANWTNVYSKSGAALETVGAVTSAAFVPTATQWRKETVSLTGFTSGNILVKFVGTSDYGNNLYLDNINLKQCLQQTLTATSNKNVLCKGQTATITVNGASTYSWSSSAQTGSALAVSPTITTSYTIISTDANACSNSVAFIQSVSTCAGISGTNPNVSAVNLFPNPTSGMTNLSIELVQNEMVSVSVVNSIGQEVYSNSNNLNAGVNTIQLNSENWATGVYFIKVATPNGVVNQKLTVNK